MELSGKVALVTGGSRGIGKATCLALANAGAAIAFTYREQRETAEMVAQQIREKGGQAMVMQMEVCDRQSVRGCINQIETTWGGSISW